MQSIRFCRRSAGQGCAGGCAWGKDKAWAGASASTCAGFPAGQDSAADHDLCRPCPAPRERSEEHTSELQSHLNLVCRLLLEKKKKNEKSLDIPQITDVPH